MTAESATEHDQLSIDLTADGETFTIEAGRVSHALTVGQLQLASSIAVIPDDDGDPKGAWWNAFLKGARPEPRSPAGGSLHIADLFCGPGGLALGAGQLAAELGVRVVTELANDVDSDATLVYSANHAARRRSNRSARSFLDYQIKESSDSSRFLYAPEIVDRDLAESLSRVDLVMAGPPCQGHSNLNNHSRRDDPRNSLYLTVPAFAVASGASMCIIENVPAIVHDYQDVVAIAEDLFRSEGYELSVGVLSASAMGWPQTRKRHFLVARRDVAPIPLAEVAALLAESEPRSAWWAIGDLEDTDRSHLMDQPTELSEENMARVDWLFDNEEFDLALPERPMSHREGTSYISVYGRMKKELPAQTITTGFMSPGRGRYVHPSRRRSITAHEAARLQGFPDTYRFEVDPAIPPTRAKLAKWIGDAVPMPLGYAASLSVLGGGLPRG